MVVRDVIIVSWFFGYYEAKKKYHRNKHKKALKMHSHFSLCAKKKKIRRKIPPEQGVKTFNFAKKNNKNKK